MSKRSKLGPTWALWKKGDIILVRSKATLIGRLIGIFQNNADAPTGWTHTAVYIGDGVAAESTYPHGGQAPVSKWLTSQHDLRVWRDMTLTPSQVNTFAEAAVTLSPNKYDTISIVRHFIDNVVERMTWNGTSGFRPLSWLLKDPDKDKKLLCSEMVEYAYNAACGRRFQPGDVGQARPNDIQAFLIGSGRGLVIDDFESGKRTTNPNWRSR